MGACYSKTGTHKEDDEDDDRWSEEQLLHHVPGRLFSNGSCNIASLHTQQGKKGINQDAMIVWEVCFHAYIYIICSCIKIVKRCKVLLQIKQLCDKHHNLMNYFEYIYCDHESI